MSATTLEDQFACLTKGFDELLQGVMLMPVSDDRKTVAYNLIGATMENLTRLLRDWLKFQMEIEKDD